MDKLLRFGNHLFVNRSSVIYIRSKTIGLPCLLVIADQQYSLEHTIDYNIYLSILRSLDGKDSSEFVRFGNEIIIRKDKIQFISFDKNKKLAQIDFIDAPTSINLGDPVTYNDIVEYVTANSLHFNQIIE